MSYRQYDPFPIYCFSCEEMRSCNDALKDKICEWCGSTDIAKYGTDTRSLETTRKHQSWHDGEHFCPKCKSYGLRFEQSLMFFD